ncbi:MAG: N-(5'-phosphoribosyl)anthranilate isomerase [Planktomarina sp.]
MAQLPGYLTPEQWVAQAFSTAEVMRGGVVKRRIRDVERIAGRDYFFDQATKRGFQVLQNHNHFIVLCNPKPIKRVGGIRPFEGP